jgi:ABC-type bacteriocin/lantibiotic exporter with double-glycine peptidase domain
MADYVSVYEPLKKLLKLARNEKKDIGRIYLYAIMAGLINLSLPLGIQSIINFLQSGQISTSWIVLVIFVMTGIVLGGILQFFQMYIIEKLSQRFFANAAFEITWKLPNLRLSAIDNIHAPEMVNRFFDVLTLQKSLSKLLMDFSASLLQVLFGLLLLSLYHPLFIGFSFFILLFFIVVYRFTIPRGLQTNLAESKYKYKTVYWLEEIAGSILSFKLAGRTRLHIDKSDELVSEYVKARKAHFRIIALQYAFSVLLKILIAGGLLIAGSLLVLGNQMNLGQFVAAEIIILLISSSIDKLITGLETVYDVLTAVEKIDQLAGLPVDEKPAFEPGSLKTTGGMQVTLHSACLQYPETLRESISGISLDIKPGERVIIGGWKGSGRSAIMHLISGSFQPTGGALSFDGVPARNLMPETIRNQTGYFLKAETIFHGNVLENVGLGRPWLTFEDVEKAVIEVGLKPWLDNQAEGYQTVLNPDGHKLEQNIITKLLLARSIAGNPRLLLMEYPTENLNAEDCSLICRLLMNPDKAWTLIAVTSSKELAQAAQRVIVLKDGAVFADGSHQELSKKDWYGTLFYS